jgi:putative addiction module component (TIGR02574 family)
MNTQIQELSNAARILLAEELWDSVAKDDKLFPLTEEQKELLNVRLAKYMLDKESGASWNDVKKRIIGNEQNGHCSTRSGTRFKTSLSMV